MKNGTGNTEHDFFPIPKALYTIVIDVL